MGGAMKKIVAILLSLMLIFNITACAEKQVEPITCEELITVYKDAGYSVLYHGHEGDECYHDLGMYCCFEIRDPNNENNFMYVNRYFNEEDAKAANQEQRYNVILWLFFGIFGEWRWMRKGVYGDIYYTTFDKEILKPLKELIKQK